MKTYTFSRAVLEQAAKGIMYRDETGDSLTALKILFTESTDNTEQVIWDMLSASNEKVITVNIPGTAKNYVETGRWTGRVLIDATGERVEIEQTFDTKEEALGWVTGNIPSPYEECYEDHFSGINAKAGDRLYGFIYAETRLK